MLITTKVLNVTCYKKKSISCSSQNVSLEFWTQVDQNHLNFINFWNASTSDIYRTIGNNI